MKLKENIEALQGQRTELLLQRSQAKDIIEQCDRRLDTVVAVLAVMEKLQSEMEEAVQGPSE